MNGVDAWPAITFARAHASRINEGVVRDRTSSSPLSLRADAQAEPRTAVTDPPQFDRIYVEHFHHVLRWARALGGMDADLDDLAQDVFLIVRRKLDTFSGPSMHAWLYGITRKTVSDYRRRAWFKRLRNGLLRSLETTSDAQLPSAPDDARGLDARRVLLQVLSRMSDVRRTAFVLFEIEGYSGEEIAALEQIPVATAYTRLHHARRDFLRITAELTGQAPEEPPT